jgi:hypothetical protein
LVSRATDEDDVALIVADDLDRRDDVLVTWYQRLYSKVMLVLSKFSFAKTRMWRRLQQTAGVQSAMFLPAPKTSKSSVLSADAGCLFAPTLMYWI